MGLSIKKINKTIYCTLSSFMTAYYEGCVPQEAKLPYLTYTFDSESEFTDSLLRVKVYSNENISKLYEYADKMAELDGESKRIEDFNHYLVFRNGSPFTQIYEVNKIKALAINIIFQII